MRINSKSKTLQKYLCGGKDRFLLFLNEHILNNQNKKFGKIEQSIYKRDSSRVSISNLTKRVANQIAFNYFSFVYHLFL